jgi:hypothetical protein
VPIGWIANYLRHPGPLPFFNGLVASGITPVVVPVVRTGFGPVQVAPAFPFTPAVRVPVLQGPLKQSPFRSLFL